MQQLIITGNVGKDSETLKLGDKDKVKFSVGVYAGKDKNGITRTNWYDVIANPVFANIAKGSKVLVEGIPVINAYLAKDGTAKSSITVYANHIEVFNYTASDNNSTPF